MSKLETLSAQIVTDINDVVQGMEDKSIAPEDMIERMERLTDKLKVWKAEAEKVIVEAERIQGIVEEYKQLNS